MVIARLTYERSLYIGNCFASILYGIQLWMYFQSMYLLLTGKLSHAKMRRFYIFYGGIILILLTFELSASLLFGQEAWIEHRGTVDPVIYLTESTSLWYMLLGDAAAKTVNILSDGLLLYRCYIICGSRFWITAFPSLVFFASSVIAVITVVEGAVPGSKVFAGTYPQLLMAWISLTVGLNIIVTVLISARLLMMRRLAHSVLPPEVGAKYTSIVAIFVESALPFSLLGIGMLITCAMASYTEVAFSCIWGLYLGTAPQMIILRVAMGSGWTEETMAQITNPMSSGMLVFAPSDHEPSQTVQARLSSTFFSWAKSRKLERSQSDLELHAV